MNVWVILFQISPFTLSTTQKKKPLLLCKGFAYLHANGRSQALFDINFWNMHQRTTDLLIRTNNSAEFWRRRLSSIIQCQHPTLWTFINSLKNEEHFIHSQLVKLNAGEPNKKYMYLNYSKRLRHLIMHSLPTLFEQLDGLAHNL